MLRRPQKGWCKNGAYPLSLAGCCHAEEASVDAFQSLLRSLPQPPPCPLFHHPAGQAAACLPPAPSYTTGWIARVAGGQAACWPVLAGCWNGGRSRGDYGRDLSSLELCLFFFCNPPRWSGRAQLQGTKQAESLASFCTLLPISWRLLSWQISRLGLLVRSVRELLGTAAVPEALASSSPAALLHDHWRSWVVHGV